MLEKSTQRKNEITKRNLNKEFEMRIFMNSLASEVKAFNNKKEYTSQYQEQFILLRTKYLFGFSL